MYVFALMVSVFFSGRRRAEDSEPKSGSISGEHVVKNSAAYRGEMRGDDLLRVAITQRQPWRMR